MGRRTLTQPFLTGAFALAAGIFAGPCAVAAPQGADASAIAADRAARSAYDAFRAGSAAGLARHEQALRGQVLEPYYDYWKLRLRLRETSGDEITQFLSTYEGTSLAETLRDDWLKLLGQRRNWDEFAAVLGPREREDPEVRCYALAARLARGDQSAKVPVIAAWLAPGTMPDGCRHAAERLIKEGEIGPERIRIRLRMLFAEGQMGEARRTLVHVDRNVRPAEPDLRLAARHPAQVLARKLPGPDDHKARELALLAFLRLSAETPHRAATALEGTWSGVFDAMDERQIWRAIALGGARRHDPRALEWFARVPASLATDAVLVWKVRAALRAGDWTVVGDTIDALPSDARRDPAWIYWRARAFAETGRKLEAQTRYLSIFRGTGFYNLLAAEELGEQIAIPEPAHLPSEEDIELARAHPALARGLALHRIGLREDSMREWVHAVRTMSDTQLLAAAELAFRAGAYERAINTAGLTTTRHNYALRYLAPYRDVFSRHAHRHGVDESLVYAVVRQESRFWVTARSPAGARGLMQVMPATARWVARQTGLRGVAPERMMDVDTNINLGTKYLRTVFDRFEHPLLVFAAYNAGPSRAAQWQGVGPIEGAIYAETIPFGETRDYVKKVLSNAMFYAALLQGRSLTLKELLGSVPAVRIRRSSHDVTRLARQ